MSVRSRGISPAETFLRLSKTQINLQLEQYRMFHVKAQQQISKAVSLHISRTKITQQQLRNTIEDLQARVAELSDENVSLKQQLKIRDEGDVSARKPDPTSVNCSQILIEEGDRDSGLKKPRVTPSKQNKEEDQMLIEANQGDESISEEPSSIWAQGLEVIRQESEADYSLTMSLTSLASSRPPEELLGSLTGSPHYKPEHDKENRHIPINSYHDALQILKNYNNGRGARMDKKPSVSICQTLPSSDVSLAEDNRSSGDNKRKTSEAILKIQKLRMIEQLEVESRGSSLRSGLSIEEGLVNQKIDGTSSWGSLNLSQSTSGKQLISLEEPISVLLNQLQQIKGNMTDQQSSITVTADMQFIRYAEGWSYQGACDKAGLPSGYGKLKINHETVYQGQWKQGVLHGWGKLLLLHKSLGTSNWVVQVEGSFRQGTVSGTVLCFFANGERFMGTINRGKAVQEGTYVTESGIMTGKWEASKLVSVL